MVDSKDWCDVVDLYLRRNPDRSKVSALALVIRTLAEEAPTDADAERRLAEFGTNYVFDGNESARAWLDAVSTRLATVGSSAG